jgi:hypothetical protein
MPGAKVALIARALLGASSADFKHCCGVEYPISMKTLEIQGQKTPLPHDVPQQRSSTLPAKTPFAILCSDGSRNYVREICH